MFNRQSIRQGMTVYSSDGTELGQIVASNEDTFQIGKGFFFPTEFLARFTDVEDLKGDKLYLSRDAEWLRSGGKKLEGLAADGKYLSMPLMEEVLEIRKHPVQKGHVSLHKKIEVETKTVDVPLRREVVHVERFSGSTTPGADYHAFEDQTISMDIDGEEIEVVKRAVPRGEVRLSKTAGEEQRHLTEAVRYENVEVLRTGEIGDDQLDSKLELMPGGKMSDEYLGEEPKH